MTVREGLDGLWEAFEPGHGKVKTIQAMEGLRAIAVFMVFLVHYVALFSDSLTPGSASLLIAEHMASIGNAGVDLFFVISGFLIYRMLIRRPRPPLVYLRRRIQRIYPTFLAVLAVYVVVMILVPSTSKFPSGTWPQLRYLVENIFLLPGIFDIDPIITVAWSLSYEFCFYLAVPLFVVGLQMRRWSAGTRLIILAGFSVLLFFALSAIQGPAQMLMFVSGMILSDALIVGGNRHWPPLGLPSLLLSFVGMVIVLELGADSWWRLWLLFVFCFFVVLESIVGRGPLADVCSTTPLRRFGNMSYSYFLFHGFAVRLAGEALGFVYPAALESSAGFWLLLVPVFLWSILPCAVLFLFVEQPYSLARPKKT